MNQHSDVEAQADQQESNPSDESQSTFSRLSAEAPDPQTEDAPTVGQKDLYVVGIGASAGGLEALEKMFHEMPMDTGMAFVVIQHLSPDFDTLMDELLARQTKLPIRTAENGMPLEPNTIYLMPSKVEMIVSGGKLLLTEKSKEGLTMPIDTFFRSLAQDFGSRAIGVILSGAGSDGSRGIVDIHNAGGLVIVQSEETARFSGMPRSAIATGVVDLILPPEEIAAALLRFARHPVPGDALLQANGEPVGEDSFKRLMRMLKNAHGIDFALYKPSTVMRRIQRRLMLSKSLEDFDRYVERVASDPQELNALYRDLLIGVTKFFRDRDAFHLVETIVVPDIIDRVPPEEEIRVWVAGCATGEEAYSLAIILHEQLTAADRPLNVKIFATDVHQHSLDVAATGVYPAKALQEVSPSRRSKYFTKVDGDFQVSSALRQMVVFARHNIITDAPFTRLDLISCRNLLIYLQPMAQKKAMSLFHFGLKKGGYLFLGPSESPGDLTDEFDCVDLHWRIYRKRRDARLPPDLRMPLAVEALASPKPTKELQGNDELHVYAQLVNQFVPPSVLVDNRRRIIHIFNRAGQFLQIHDGRPSNDILDHLDMDLKTAVAGAIQQAAKERKPVSYSGVQLERDGEPQSIRLIVTPIYSGLAELTHYLISFEPMQPLALPAGAAESAEGAFEADDLSRARIASLEAELQRTRENLQATIEELETSNEELQAANEELIASNEELQSTNEELHSVNEELYTVNAEYQKKITELTELSEDMDNLLSSTEVGVIFLDGDLAIRKFTPLVRRLFNISETDIGRSFDHFTHNIEYDQLMDDIRSVHQSDQMVEREVRDRFGHWHLLRICPYRSKSQIQGVVVTIIDIQSLKQAQEQLTEKDRELRAILEFSPAFMFIKDLNGQYRIASAAAERFLGVPPEKVIGKTVYDLLPRATADRLRAKDREVAATGKTIEFEFEFEIQGVVRSIHTTKYPLRDERGNITAIAGMWIDILPRTLAEKKAKQTLAYRDRFLATLSHELRNPVAAMNNAVQLIQRKLDDRDAVRRAVEIFSRQLVQVKRLLDDLLDLSRIMRGEIELRKRVIDLREVTSDSILATRSVVQSHELNLESEITDKPLPVYGDPVRLQQMIVNLLVNATKYTPAGGQIHVALERKRNRAVLTIRDTGVGMSQDLLEKIFEPFVQADETLARSEGGLGLGLTLVKSIVEAHGGTVTAHSDGEGQGSTFTVSLPLTQRTPKDDEPSKESDDQIDRPKLLIVEDIDDAREMLKLLLESEGYEVVAAPDGPTALQLIETESPDVALVDIGLPEMDGYELARRIRQKYDKSEIRLIALTGYGRPSDRKKARKAGFDGHLVKPVHLDQLEAELARVSNP
ncbi:MAG: response regulator [Planctomycetota bacterium]|nr:MAG: response regulator [Planctomycetota bacterium]